MFNFIQIARALSALKAAIVGEDLAGIAAAAKSLGELFGFAPESAALAALLQAAADKDLAGAVKHAGELLLAIAGRLSGPALMFAAPDGSGCEAMGLDAAIGQLAHPHTKAAGATPEGMNPLPVIFAIIQFVAWLRKELKPTPAP